MYLLVSLRMSRLRDWLSQEGAKRHKCRRMIFPHEINFKKKVKKIEMFANFQSISKNCSLQSSAVQRVASWQAVQVACSAAGCALQVASSARSWRSPFSNLTVLLHGIHARSRNCMRVFLDRSPVLWSACVCPWQYFPSWPLWSLAR